MLCLYALTLVLPDTNKKTQNLTFENMKIQISDLRGLVHDSQLLKYKQLAGFYVVGLFVLLWVGLLLFQEGEGGLFCFSNFK